MAERILGVRNIVYRIYCIVFSTVYVGRHTLEKKVGGFLSPAGMSLTKLSLAGNYLFSDIPAGDRKTAYLLFQYGVPAGNDIIVNPSNM